MATRFNCADDRFPRLQRGTGPYDNGGRLNRADGFDLDYLFGAASVLQSKANQAA
jgi:hypothetical protein